MISLKQIDKNSKRLQAHADGALVGMPSQQRVLWMAMFSPGLEGRRGLPYVLVAEPGTAKTSSMKWLARKASLPFWSVLGSIRQPVDFMGCPVPQRRKLTKFDQHLSPDGDDEFLFMHYAPAGFAVQAATAKNGVMLFDEANNMPPAVQSAMLRVLFEGVVGELELPPGIRMFLATNSIEDAAGGWDISPAMANRMGWIEWEGVSVERRNAYAAASGGRGMAKTKIEPIDYAEEEAKVDALWDNAWAQATMLVSGFLTRRGELLHKKPKDASKAWPSARTWDLMEHALAGSFIYDLSGVERQIACSAYIGSAAYSEFYAYAKDADLPDPAVLLDGNVMFDHNPGRLDRTAAVLSGCLSVVLREQQQNRVDALWSILNELPESALDVTVPTVVQLAQGNMMVGSPVAYQVFAKIDPIVNAARMD